MTAHGEKTRDAAIVGVILTLGSLLLIINQARRFDSFDMSAFMDAGWRIFNGQHPYVDFEYNAGPVHLYMHALSFALFGFGRVAVIAHLLTVNAIAVSITYLVARRYVSWQVAAMCTVLSAVAFAGPISQPWYDQTAWMWIFVGLGLFELTRSVDVKSWRAGIGALSAGAAVALAFMTKANIGLAGGMAVGIGIFASTGRLRSLLWYALGGVVAMCVLLIAIGGPVDFVDQTLVTYAPGARLEQLPSLLVTAVGTPYLLGTSLVTGLVVVRACRFAWPETVPLTLFVGLSLAAIFAVWTGSMVRLGNTAPYGILLAYAAAILLGDGKLAWRRVSSLILVGTWTLLLVTASVGTAQLLVWTWRASDVNSTYAMRTPAVAGWYAPPEIGHGVDDVVAYLNTNVPAADTVFVFPDTTLIYGLSGRPSYTPAPFIFQIGVFPLPGRYQDDFRATFAARPPSWIVLHYQTEIGPENTNDLLAYLQLDTLLRDRYTERWRSGSYSVLQLASPSNASSCAGVQRADR